MPTTLSPTTPGLDTATAQRRLAEDGPNTLQLAAPVRLWRLVLGQLRDMVVVVLIVAAVLTAAVGDLADMTIILAVIVINTALGAGQEFRSSRALEALAELTAPRATVVRDGVHLVIPAADVVRGDALVLAAGDIVAADAAVDTAQTLQLDESMMTGESLPVSRGPEDEVLAGSVVTRGSGLATVTRTGAATAIGRIGRAVHDGRAQATPLQHQLSRLGRQLALLVTGAVVVVAAIALLRGQGLETSVVLALSLAVAAIPESLPAVVALSLALAARRMSARGVLVRRLAAVETLGSITELCVDKTGTITEGRMSLASADTVAEEVVDLLTACVLCNDAEADGTGEHDDPTEVALVSAAVASGLDVDGLRAAHPRLRETPFDAGTARMTTWHRTPAGLTIAVSKGSPESIAELVADPGVTAAAAPHAARGERVLGVAVQRDEQWRLLGLVALADPPRAEAADTVAAFGRAGVRVIMITGDHVATARSVAAAAGIADGADVFARVSPDGKADIVRQLREAGGVVAMTGDGVNDAPAMRAADLGIAMGRRGTEVAKQAADLVLTGDDLTALLPAVQEGRRAWDNLARFLHYAVAGGVAEVLVMLFGPLVGLAVPLRSGQILWVNLLTHGLPGVAFGNEPAAADALSRPPRRPDARLVDAHRVQQIAVLAAVVGAGSLLAGVLGDRAQTTLFVSLTLAQLGIALALRPSWREANPLLLGAVVLNVGLVALAVWWSPLQHLLHTDALGVADVLIATALAAPCWPLARWQRNAAASGRPESVGAGGRARRRHRG